MSGFNSQSGETHDFVQPMPEVTASFVTQWMARLSTCIAVLLWMVLLSVNPAGAAETITLVDGTEVYPLTRLSYLEDKDGRMNLQDVMTGEGGLTFVPGTKDVANFSFTKSAYWFRFELVNKDSPIDNWLLEVQYTPLDRITVYLVDADGNAVTYRGGDKWPFAKRAIKHRNVMFKVPVATGQSVRVFVRVLTDGSLQLPLVLRSPDALLAQDHEEQAVLGVFYGVLLAMLLYNLLIFVSIRDINYLYYVWYIAGWIMFQMSINGLAFEYILPEYPAWANKAIPFSTGFANLGVLLFSRGFLQVPQNLPRVNHLFKACAILTVGIMLSSLFGSYNLSIKVGAGATILIAVMIVSVGIWSIRLGVRQARYFMVAWTGLLVGIVVYALKTFAVLPTTFVTEYGMQIGSAFEVILLSFALAHRMRILKEDNERMQRETTETLERRVQERTRELDEALMGLSDANSKLMELNHVDGLTGINNRAYFDEQFGTEWQRSMRIGSPIGLLMLDIDHFKQFNDNHGHLGGDACLKLVANTIQDAIRRPADKCYRYGGEEFVAVLPHTDLPGSAFIADRICKAVAALEFVFEGKTIPVTISIGVCSMVPPRGSDYNALISAADQALYEAKHQGRNRYCTSPHAAEA